MSGTTKQTYYIPVGKMSPKKAIKILKKYKKDFKLNE